MRDKNIFGQEKLKSNEIDAYFKVRWRIFVWSLIICIPFAILSWVYILHLDSDQKGKVEALRSQKAQMKQDAKQLLNIDNFKYSESGFDGSIAYEYYCDEKDEYCNVEKTKDELSDFYGTIDCKKSIIQSLNKWNENSLPGSMTRYCGDYRIDLTTFKVVNVFEAYSAIYSVRIKFSIDS